MTSNADYDQFHLYPSVSSSQTLSAEALAICETYSLTAEQFTSLSTGCIAAKATAYCPYSRFRVGATILTVNGEYISGANVENASYPVSTCAERVAFGTAVTSMKGGYRPGLFKALAIATDISPPASPCGMCRQYIREFCGPEMPIFMFDKDGKFAVMSMGQLLPLSFGPQALPPPEALPVQNEEVERPAKTTTTTTADNI